MKDATLRFIVFLSLSSAVISQEEDYEYDITLSHCEAFDDGNFHLISAVINSSSAMELCSSSLSKVDFTLTPPGGQTKVLCNQEATMCNLTFNARKCRCAEERPDGTMVFELMYKHPKGGSLNSSGSVGTGAGILTVVTNCASMTISSCGNATDAIPPFKEKSLSVVIFTVITGVCLGVFAVAVVGASAYCRRRETMEPGGAPPVAVPPETGAPPERRPSTASIGEILPEPSTASTTEQSTTKPPSLEGSEFSEASSAQLGSEVDDDASTLA